MPRIRTIKPEFWTDEKIVELSIPARLFFIGLWNFADDNGVLENKPKQLKIRIFPTDKVNIEAFLEELISQGIIAIYEVEGASFIWIKYLRRHQIIDRPRKSNFPPPPETLINTTQPEINSNQLKSIEISAGREGKGIGKERNNPPPTPPGGNGVVPFLKVQESWNRNAPPLLPRIKILDEKRKRLIKAAWQEHPELLWFDGFFRDIALSDHHSGKNDKGWVPDISWILKERVRLQEKFDSLKESPGRQGVSPKARNPDCPRCHGSGLYKSGETPDHQPIMSTCDCDKNGPYEPKKTDPVLPAAG